MSYPHESKIFSSVNKASELINQWKAEGYKIVFTNGCFDLIHRGHIVYLEEARALGDKLVLGLNSDLSVKGLKGPKRPIQSEIGRASVLAGLRSVDLVLYFDEETPLNLIKAVLPDILVKGGDYTLNEIVGAKEVLGNGGKVEVLSFIEGESTSSIIQKIKES